MTKISPADRGTRLWHDIEEHLQRRLQALREQNDNQGMTADQTAIIRGRIAEVKSLLALGTDDKVVLD